jgi:hypothetical protein
MTYFNRKEIIKILAEKPDMMVSFPPGVLREEHKDDIARIPDVALCDISMFSVEQAFDQVFLAERPDAVLPAVVYCGTERVRWSAFDSVVKGLKKELEKTWHVHVLPPIILGAPLFRSALTAYADTHSDQPKRLALQCAACSFYRAAVCIPLCKKLSIRKLYLGSPAPCCYRSVDLEKSAGLLKYCKILLSGYGIDLSMTSEQTVMHRTGICYETAVPGFECFAAGRPGCEDLRYNGNTSLFKSYFENFAIPFAANIMSGLLAGNVVDFDECAHSFYPAGKRSPKKNN